MGMPREHVHMKMMADGVDPADLGEDASGGHDVSAVPTGPPPPPACPPPAAPGSNSSSGGDTVVAQFEFCGQNADELSFKEGDVVTVLSRDQSGWWMGQFDSTKGLFPANYTNATTS